MKKLIILFSLIAVSFISYSQTLPLPTKKAGPTTYNGSYNNSYQFTQELQNTLKKGTSAFKTTVNTSPTATARNWSSYYGTDSTGRGFFYNDRRHFTFADSNQTLTASASALVELKSTEKGFLVPRMTEEQKNAVNSPQQGLLIYQTNVDTGFYVYKGAAWEQIGGSSGAVTSVSGTGGRITSTGGATPIIDIDGTYSGQTSISTLGTISTGTWQGTTIAVLNGGTGTTTSTGTGNVVLSDNPAFTQFQATHAAFTGFIPTSFGSGNSWEGALRFYNAGNLNGVNITVPTGADEWQLTLPANNGSANQFLQTDGNGITSWATAGSGTVTSTSVVTANGVSGSVANPTTTPAITLTLGDITPNSVAATTMVSAMAGSFTSANSLALGTLSSATGKISFKNAATAFSMNIQSGATSGANYTLTLPVDDGTANQVLTTNGSGALSWESGVSGCAISCGTFSSSITNVNNIDNSSAFDCQYMRVGNTVTFSGRFDADATAAGAAALRISLPIASDFLAITQAGGTGATVGAITSEFAQLSASIVNNDILVQWIAIDTGNQTWSFTVTYQIL